MTHNEWLLVHVTWMLSATYQRACFVKWLTECSDKDVCNNMDIWHMTYVTYIYRHYGPMGKCVPWKSLLNWGLILELNRNWIDWSSCRRIAKTFIALGLLAHRTLDCRPSASAKITTLSMNLPLPLLLRDAGMSESLSQCIYKTSTLEHYYSIYFLGFGWVNVRLFLLGKKHALPSPTFAKQAKGSWDR